MNIVKMLEALFMMMLRMKGVKLVAPNLSFEASGTIGKIITYAKVRGIKYARSWFKPANPQTAGQVNIRTALTLAIPVWQNTFSQAQKDAFDSGASGTKDTGFSLYMSRALDEYISQLGTGVTPTSLVVSGTYPSETYTWT